MVKALLLGSLPYRSSLVARTTPLVGLIGAPLLLISNLGVLFGLRPHVSALTAISALPIALWSSRWASGWSPKASSPRPSPMEWSLPVCRKKMIMPRSEAVHGPSSTA